MTSEQPFETSRRTGSPCRAVPCSGRATPTTLVGDVLLRYGSGDWNALYRDLYGELRFRLQIVVNLNDPDRDHTGGEFLIYEQEPAPDPESARWTTTAAPPKPGSSRGLTMGVPR